MMGGWGHSHHVDPWSPEDGIIEGLNVEDTELCDDVERVCTDWELDRPGGTSLAPIKTVEE